MKKLYIAEKPSVGKAIAESLAQSLGVSMNSVRGSKGPTHITVGREVVVSWCFGHILEQASPEDYDEGFRNWRASFAKLPMIPTSWVLKPVKSSQEQLDVLRDLSNDCDLIVNAGDPDREGQLLVDEVLEYIGCTKPANRILPNAIDPASMKKILANEKSNKEFRGLYESALGRQRADWLVGMNLSRALTIRNEQNGMNGILSVGRVQTPTLAMIVKRCEEIENFKAQDYFTIVATFQHEKGSYRGLWKAKPGMRGLDSEGRLTDQIVAQTVMAATQGKVGAVTEYKVEDQSQKAPLPFSLSALQAKASAAYGMSAQKVLEVCQSLYETHKVATYPRTDCQYLPEDQLAEAPGVLAAICDFSPEISSLVKGANPRMKGRVFDTKKVTAHHAIIPTSNANYKQLTDAERKIFGLIVKFYLAQFYPDFLYKQTSVTTEVSGHSFRSSGRTPIDFGWRKVFGADKDEAESAEEADAKAKKADDGDEDQMLPAMSKGDPSKCLKTDVSKKKTKPPAYYTEGTLIKAMTNVHETVDDPELKAKLKEVKGIGTEATRASTIETLKSRNFIVVEKNKIMDTPGGRAFIKAIPDQLRDVAMTAMWENALDQIERGAVTLDRFLEGQSQWLRRLTKAAQESNISVAIGIKSNAASQSLQSKAGKPCPKCGKGIMRTMQAKKGPNEGKLFLGCSNYPECKHAENIEGQDDQKGSSRGRSSAGTEKKSSSNGGKSTTFKSTGSRRSSRS